MNKARLGGLLGIVYCIAGFFLIFLGWNGAATYDQVDGADPVRRVRRDRRAGPRRARRGADRRPEPARRPGRAARRRSTTCGRPSSAGRRRAAAAAEPAAAAVSGGTVMAGPTSYHRPTCRVIAGQVDVVAMSRSAAVASDRTPCRVCTPDAPTLTAAS